MVTKKVVVKMNILVTLRDQGSGLLRKCHSVEKGN